MNCTGHTVTPEDSKRIRCQHSDCKEQATQCSYDRFNVGGRHGVSFYYHCKEHAK